jgi:glycosyltransferase involved in cell wall biosynthesis
MTLAATASNEDHVTGAKPRRKVLFLGSAYAGHRTRFLNLKEHTQSDNRIEPTYREVTGWQEQGVIESLPLLPRSVKGRIRAVSQCVPLAGWPRPDVIWTSVAQVSVPFLWAQSGPLARPMVLDLDSTLEQLETFSDLYFQRPPKQGLRKTLGRLMERALWSKTALFTPWSNWAARGLIDAGVPRHKIEVSPPGVDLEQWQPRPGLRQTPSGKMRLLFVGGDFVRKGGNLLLDVFSSRLVDVAELHIVTRDDVQPRPGVTIHRAEPNSQQLRELYAQADLFVLPTQAECFGIATIEAMASGLPVVMSNIGGAEDIVIEGETGWLIEPNQRSLAGVLSHASQHPSLLKSMGDSARSVAEARFDGLKNDRRVLDLLLSLRP